MRTRTRAPAVAAVEAVASRQLGLFTARQARNAGLGSQTLAYHARPEGRWRHVLPEVYEVLGLPPDPRRPLLAAQLWAGAGAVLSHRAAGWILALDGIDRPIAELSMPRSTSTGGVILHRRRLAAADIATTGLLRHTTPRRTLIDLAHLLDDDALELALESVLRRDPSVDLPCRRPARLVRVLGRRGAGVAPTESELETRYVQVIRRTSLPAPERQMRVTDRDGRILGRLDICWPEARLWVELDGAAFHGDPDALHRDRHRQNDLAIHLQWLPLRFTWADVVHRPAATARTTERAYRRRLGSGG